MPVNIGVNIQRSPNRINQQLREAGVEGKFPKLLLDFKDQYYLASGGSKTLANAVTHARSGNATMTDGYGPELVTNGGFDSGTTGWTNHRDAVLTVTDGKLNIAIGTNTYSGIIQEITLKSGGGTYDLEFDFTKIDANARATIGTTSGGSEVIDSLALTSAGKQSVRFTTTTETVYVKIYANTATAGESITIDNVSVREMPVLKWAPHNLLPTPDNFSNTAADANVTSGQSDPDGGTDAFEIDITSASGDINHGVSVTSGVQYSIDFIIKPDSTASSWIRVNVASVSSWFEWDNDWAEGTTGTGFVSIASENLGSGWYKVKVTATAQSTGTLFFGAYHASADGNTSESISTTYLYQIHAYRSDLGGMVANPDQPASRASYVPTTSAAKYLPRVGHHVYNGNAWVNEGLLAESEARTNIVNKSNEFTATNWSKGGVTVTSAAGISPDGNNNAFKVSETATTGTHICANTGTATACYSVFAKAGTNTRFRINSGASGNGYATFDLSGGTIIAESGTAFVDATMQDCGNGWYRCALALDSSATSTFSIVLEDSSGNVSYTGNTANHLFVYGGQVESNVATPSSYIPTPDTTSVTRAAETFTIPSANLPWPSPNYIGSELVTNGTFDTDSDWTKTDFTISGGQASTSSGTLGHIDQSISFVSGKVYELSVDVVSISGGSASIQARGVSTVSSTIGAGDSGTTHKFIYADTANNTTIRVYAGSSTNLTVDNISVREINPLSVSIAMDGRITYADTGTTEAVLYGWVEDSSNLVNLRISGSGGRIGEVQFRQEEGGTLDVVTSATTYLSPDVLVPYSFASRHGSTFINGATDGVALTANTTPTALPDLSATDANLANDYMGTIGTFRVWDKDLGDTGLVEATNPSLEPSLSLTFEGAGTNSFVVNDWSE